jgi:hypothetical protein
MLLGATSMGAFVAGLFFLRSYRQTRDSLFGWFGAAFWLLSAQAFAVGLTTRVAENAVALYVPRLMAFVLIIVGIVQKNRRA